MRKAADFWGKGDTRISINFFKARMIQMRFLLNGRNVMYSSINTTEFFVSNNFSFGSKDHLQAPNYICTFGLIEVLELC